MGTEEKLMILKSFFDVLVNRFTDIQMVSNHSHQYFQYTNCGLACPDASKIDGGALDNHQLPVKPTSSPLSTNVGTR